MKNKKVIRHWADHFFITLFRAWISPYTRKTGANIGAATVYIYTQTY